LHKTYNNIRFGSLRSADIKQNGGDTYVYSYFLLVGRQKNNIAAPPGIAQMTVTARRRDGGSKCDAKKRRKKKLIFYHITPRL